MKFKLRKIVTPMVLAVLVGPLMVNCGAAGMPGVPGGLPNVPGAPAGCPDMSSTDAIANYDFVKEWQLQADTSAKLKNGVIAAIDIKAFSDKLEADLKAACTDLAGGFGVKGDYPSADAACKAAIGAVGDARGKLGAKAQIGVEFQPPKCGASMDVMEKCAASCDGSVKGGDAKVTCEPGKLQGTCDAKCEGSCDMTAAAACDGTCSGTCDANVKGSCGGNCTGKCDGKTSSGATCTGTCDGKCDAKVEGTCSGKCGGTCKMKAAASCQGTCTGKCSAEMKAPKCTGEMTPPKVSAECKARCDGEVHAKMECTPASASVKVEGSADAKLAAQYKMAIEKSLPAILKIAIGMGEQAVKMAANIKDVVESVQASVEASVKAGGASGVMTAGRIGACFGDKFKGAVDAAGSVKANVNVSVSVKASASASGSGSAAGHTG